MPRLNSSAGGKTTPTLKNRPHLLIGVPLHLSKDSSSLYIFAPDIHYPLVHWPSFNALLDFLDKNDVSGFIFGGDQFDNQEVSPHTRKKPKLRFEAKTLSINAKGFDKKVLTPIEERLSETCQRIWIEGNHDDWLSQYIEEHPELEGSLERPEVLTLKERGWEIFDCGIPFRKGKVTFIHGETLTGIGNQVSGVPAKKAVEAYCGNVVFGHFHALQVFTKIMPHDQTQKWMAVCSPCLGATNPNYLRNRPTAWMNGFVIVEFHPNGTFNIFPVVITKGTFSYGGEVYGAK
jgi:predicted phosphodiesterase